MSRYRRFEMVEHTPSYLLSPFLDDELLLCLDPTPLDLLPTPPSPLLLLHDDFDTVTDLIQIHSSTRRVTRRVDPYYLDFLSDRVSALELGLDRLLREERRKKRAVGFGERKYTWAAEVKSPDDEKERKYKWTAEIKDGKKGSGLGLEKNFKWTAEIKGKGGERSYSVKVSSGGSEEEKKKKGKGKEKEKGVGSSARIVEIEEPSNHGALVLKQAFAKRIERLRGKRKELSPQDAAALIQISFRAYLIRRSQALRALRELAIAKAKLKELRALFNSSYRRHIVRDAEERQRFTEKIVVLLLTVDAIEGADLMVRAAKKSMVDELEAMLDVVDPQPHAKSPSGRRRTFDMPDGVINKELAAGVAQVVQMLDQEAGSESFEACL